MGLAMHKHTADPLKHSHHFHSDNRKGERGTYRVIVLTGIMMILESDSECRISDLHIWRIGSHHLSAIVCIVTYSPKSPSYYRELLCKIPNLDHITIEVNACSEETYTKDKQRLVDP